MQSSNITDEKLAEMIAEQNRWLSQEESMENSQIEEPPEDHCRYCGCNPCICEDDAELEELAYEIQRLHELYKTDVEKENNDL